MKFIPTHINGVTIIAIEPVVDDRGFFARTLCEEEYAEAGLPTRFIQQSVSFSPTRHTLRGLHFQARPHEETKIVRCTRGAAFDVVVDLRSDSETYLDHVTVRLSEDEHNAVHVPPGCAHGHMTLLENTELLYLMTVEHRPESARGVRWNDEVLAIQWPAEPILISERDRGYPDLEVREQ